MLFRSASFTGIVTASSFVPSSGYIKAPDGTNSFYIYSGTGNVAFQGTIGASQINNASGFKALDFTSTSTPFVNITNGLNVGSAFTVTSSGNVVTSGIVTASQFSTGSTGIGINTDTISGPPIMYIDPSPVGVGTTSGIVRIRGDLYVDEIGRAHV